MTHWQLEERQVTICNLHSKSEAIFLKQNPTKIRNKQTNE
jgi:hypothetical protein